MATRYLAREGDSIPSIAFQFGFFPDTVWNHPDNSSLKSLRGNMNTLEPGDEVAIPDLALRHLDRSVDQCYRFRRKGVPAIFRLQVFQDEHPRANQPYTLIIDGVAHQGTSDDQGVIESPLPPDSREGTLRIGPDNYTIELRFGSLRPNNEIIGWRQRLNNLGYNCGEPSNDLDDLTRDAIRYFQRRMQLTETGEFDDATKARLLELHDTRQTFPDTVNGQP